MTKIIAGLNLQSPSWQTSGPSKKQEGNWRDALDAQHIRPKSHLQVANLVAHGLKGLQAANLGVVVVIKVVRLLWDGRLLVLCLLVVVPDPMSREAQLIVQHWGRLRARHAALLQ